MAGVTNLSGADIGGGPTVMAPMTKETWVDTLAGVLGNVLEWYDFALFGFFSDIIAQNFFPEDDAVDNLTKSFAIFGGAFLMRPIGGIIIGYVGDKYGRKTALTRSLFLMAIPTTAMGCLPTYQSIAWMSTVLLALSNSRIMRRLEAHPHRGSYQGLWSSASSLVGHILRGLR